MQLRAASPNMIIPNSTLHHSVPSLLRNFELNRNFYHRFPLKYNYGKRKPSPPEIPPLKRNPLEHHVRMLLNSETVNFCDSGVPWTRLGQTRKPWFSVIFSNLEKMVVGIASLDCGISTLSFPHVPHYFVRKTTLGKVLSPKNTYFGGSDVRWTNLERNPKSRFLMIFQDFSWFWKDFHGMRRRCRDPPSGRDSGSIFPF